MMAPNTNGAWFINDERDNYPISNGNTTYLKTIIMGIIIIPKEVEVVRGDDFHNCHGKLCIVASPNHMQVILPTTYLHNQKVLAVFWM